MPKSKNKEHEELTVSVVLRGPEVERLREIQATVEERTARAPSAAAVLRRALMTSQAFDAWNFVGG